jgi:hypothetical protein
MAISQFSISQSRNSGQVVPIMDSIVIDDFVSKKVVSIIDSLKIEQLAH